MRTVTWQDSNMKPVYPHEGIGAYFGANRTNGVMVAFYNGTATPAQLDTYDENHADYFGEWPVVPHRTLLTPDEFIRQFTDDEWDDVLNSSDSFVIKLKIQLTQRLESMLIDCEDSRTIAAMNKLVLDPEVDIGSDRADEILKGIRL